MHTPSCLFRLSFCYHNTAQCNIQTLTYSPFHTKGYLFFSFLFFFWWTYNGLSWSISLMQSSNPLGRQIFLLLCCVGEILLHSLILLSKQVENWGLKWRGMERGRGQIISLHFKEKKKITRLSTTTLRFLKNFMAIIFLAL